MADFENVQAIRGAKLSDLSQHVRDVLAIALDEADEYQVGRVSMAVYDFVPYALTGLSAAMQTPATGTRATTHVTLPISDDKGGTDAAQQDVTLFGPGDVLGVDPGQIVRRYPSPGSTNAEETFHAHIEFDRPEVPWAFSAQTPAPRMQAWLALVALERDEIEWEPSQAGLQPIMAVAAAALPPIAANWAWAHAQATGGSASLSSRLSTAHAPINVSRLLAARILTQNTNYVACLVPTTEAGRNAGLGLPGGSLGPAWTANDGTVRLPVYDRWEFRTAPDGDFAKLARRLKGVAAPWAIGRRTMDTSRPGQPLTDLAVDELGRRQVIKCALFSPAPRPPDAPPDDAAWTPERIGALQTAVERPAVVEGSAGTDPGAIPDLPIVGPRIYAKAQRGSGTVPAGDWFAEINLTPTHRVVAGLGTRVVAKDQEQLMQAAWAQVGEIDKANRALALAELARQLANAVHVRLAKVDPGRLLQMTRPLAARVRLDGAGLTLAGQTIRSATPTAALGGSFRRAVRAAGPIARRLTTADQAELAGLVTTGGANRDFTRVYTKPDGIGGLSVQAIASLDARAVALALSVTPDVALSSITNATAAIANARTLASAVTMPALWKDPDTTFQPGVVQTQRIVSKIRERIPADPAADPVRTRWLGGLSAGVAVSQVPGTEPLNAIAMTLERAVTVVAGPVVAGPIGQGPVVAGPIGQGPIIAGPIGQGPIIAGPIGQGPIIAGPIGQGPIIAGPIGQGPIIAGPVRVQPNVRVVPVRPMGAEMLRHAAARDVLVPVGLSDVAAGNVLGSIVRPIDEVPVAAGGPAVTDRERLDRFRTPQGTALATWVEVASKVTVHDVRAQLAALIDEPGALALAPTPPRDVLAVQREDVLRRLAPDRTVIDTMRARLNLGKLAFDVFDQAMIRPIMAAPRFDRPMYQALDLYDREWLVPGLGNLPEPELVTLLSTNDKFTEAFLVGLSDEMGRELLWRSYPTDSRGTYFYRFWDPNNDELKAQIHRFAHTQLGSHVTMGPPGQSGRAVVVIRGEVVRRYPDLTVMAMRESGRDPQGRPLLPETPTGPPDAVKSLFHAMLPPDVMLAGLDITVDALRQPGWWIVISEHPQATRFRFHERELAGHEIRFAAPEGGDAHGAAVAAARIENPTRIAFEAGDFLPNVN